MSAHTPGPWRFNESTQTIVSNQSHPIARLTELLEALTFLLDSEFNGWDLVPGQEKARAAIAKATGASA